MKFQALRIWLQEQRGTLLLAAVILVLGLGLVFTRPSRPALAENANRFQQLTPITTLTATSPPTQTATPTATLTPSSTPTPTPSLTPTWTPTQTATDTPTATVTPRPAYLVWAKEGQGGNLREAPNGRILELVRNGMWVEELGQIEQEGGLYWVYVLAHFYTLQQNGWMAKSLLYPVPPGELLQVQAEEGAYLRADPQGNIRAWLGDGSPVVKLDTQEDWTSIRTLDGTEGWILSRLLIPYNIER